MKVRKQRKNNKTQVQYNMSKVYELQQRRVHTHGNYRISNKQ